MIGILIILGLLVLLIIGITFKLASDSKNMSVELGLENGRLSVCPTSPNCVSSDAMSDNSHYIPAISDPDGSKWASLVQTLNAMEGAQQVTVDGAYVYFTFSTKLMGFVDDVEFLNDTAQAEIAVRSASRVGKSDMDANRKRIEMIRMAL